ncbi:MAG: branched-chain amino acid aminotransferase [Bdellovibrionota bacterium]|nr:branched-chain amino acid aminotransferase [Bdellovibrionota bacterium]
MEIKIDPRIIKSISEFNLPTKIGFGKTLAPVMISCSYKEEKWGALNLVPYEPLTLSPTAKVFHYGQEIFEGMKAYRVNGQGPYLFRPEENQKRFNLSAERMAMPTLPEELFINSVKLLTEYCAPFIPDKSGDSLYLRPFMFATEEHLGIAPSNEFKFMVVASPSTAYFSSDSLKVLIEREYVRAVDGGTGQAKTGGNYAGGLNSAIRAKNLGFSQTLWLDSKKREFVEEMSGMNIFVVMKGKLVTPSLEKTILDGVTRRCLIRLAEDMGFSIEERALSINELIEAIQSGECSEAFACGTAVIVTPIEGFGEDDGTFYKVRSKGESIGSRLREKLLGLQEGREKDIYGWRHKVSLSYGEKASEGGVEV